MFEHFLREVFDARAVRPQMRRWYITTRERYDPTIDALWTFFVPDVTMVKEHYMDAVIDKIQPSYNVVAAIEEMVPAFDPSGRLLPHVSILVRTYVCLCGCVCVCGGGGSDHRQPRPTASTDHEQHHRPADHRQCRRLHQLSHCPCVVWASPPPSTQPTHHPTRYLLRVGLTVEQALSHRVLRWVHVGFDGETAC